jgi:hypothetical protein
MSIGYESAYDVGFIITESDILFFQFDDAKLHRVDSPNRASLML